MVIISLNKISFPSSIKYIEDSAFESCSSLKEITLPPNLTCINSNAFLHCSSLESVIIPNSVKQIDKCAFKDYSSLSNVSVPYTVQIMDDDVFYNCPLLDDFNSYDEEDCLLPEALRASFIFFSFVSFLFLFAEFIIAVVWWSRLHPWFAHGYKGGKIVYYALECCWISLIIAFVLFISNVLIIFGLLRNSRFRKKVYYQRKKKMFKKCENIYSFSSIILFFVLCLGYQHGKVSEYYCLEVGIPALIFFIIFIIVALIPTFCCFISQDIADCFNSLTRILLT